jgi:hypothetical protein
VNFDAMLKDKKTWIVAGGAGLAGLVVFLAKNKGGSGTPATVSGASGVPATGAVTADTTGTDIASYLSQVSQQNQDQFNQWGQNLSDTLKAIQGAGTTMTGNSGAIGGYTRNSDGTYRVVIGGGTNWADLMNSLRGVGLNGDIQTLINLNPGLMGDVSNYKDPGGVWQNTFKNDITVNVPTLPTAK